MTEISSNSVNKISPSPTVSYVSSYPLFDRLLEECRKRQPTVLNESYHKLLCDTLNSLNIEQMEQVILLIVHYHLSVVKQDIFKFETGKGRSQKMLYNLKCGTGGKGLSFSLETMPDILKFILGEYCLINSIL